MTSWVRFGKWQRMHGGLAKLGLMGRIYGNIVGYTQVGGFARSLLFRKLLRLEKIQFKSVLDAGCGAGDYALYIAEKYPDARVVAIDLNGERIEQLVWVKEQAGLNNLTAIIQDYVSIVDENKYDLIISISSLEYSRDKRKVLANFYRALTWGGHLLLQMPCFEQRRIFPTKYFLNYEREEKWRLDENINFHYDMYSLEKDLKLLGFEIRFLYFTTGFWGRLAFELSHILSQVNLLLYALTIPLLKLFAYFDLFVLKKKSGDGIIALCRKPLE